MLPWELLYTYDLVLIADSEDKVMEKCGKWKNGMEAKDLNLGKYKVVISSGTLNGLVQYATMVLMLTQQCAMDVGGVVKKDKLHDAVNIKCAVCLGIHMVPARGERLNIGKC